MLTQLTEHVWLFPHNADANVDQSSIGVIATGKQSLLIDAGNSPRLARQLKTEMERCNLPPVTRIIYTHHHWDHVYGAYEFNVPVTAHTLCKKILNAESKKPWGIEYLNEEVRRNPKLAESYAARASVIEDWEAFRIVIPVDTFKKTELITLGGLEIELEHIGGQHAKDSIVVKIPQDGVMFLGNCYYPPPTHLRETGSAPSFDMLEKLQNNSYDLYVESHDKPFTRAELMELLQKKIERQMFKMAPVSSILRVPFLTLCVSR